MATTVKGKSKPKSKPKSKTKPATKSKTVANKSGKKPPAPKPTEPAVDKRSPFDLAVRLALLPANAAQIDPSIPVDTIVLECERVEGAAKGKRAQFVALPDFDARDYDDLADLREALRAAERDWSRIRFKNPGEGLTVDRKKGEALRSRVISVGRFLFRRNDAVLLELDRIAEGEGLADLVTDLNDLVALVGKYAAVFQRSTKLSPPAELVTELQSLADSLGAGNETEVAAAAKGRRNAICLALETSLEEMRASARYLYGDDRKRLTPFLSQYEAARKRAQRNSAKAPKPPAVTKPAKVAKGSASDKTTTES